MPIGQYKDWNECIKAQISKGYDKQTAEKICGFLEKKTKKSELSAKDWSTEFINNLPDTAFAVIEPAYLKGDTKDKRARHLPHHSQEVAGKGGGAYTTETGRIRDDSDASVDMSHLRNAFARLEQIEPITDSISKEKLIEIAREHLKKHRDLLKTE